MNKSEHICNILIAELQAGKYPDRTRFPSEYLLADRFQINKTTANKIVSNLVEKGFLTRGGRGVGTIVTLNNSFPEGIFLFLCRELTPYVSRILMGAQQAALQQRCLITPWPHFQDNFKENLKLISPKKFKGILNIQNVLPQEPDGIPVVHIDWDHPDQKNQICSVTNNNYESGRMMMREILNHNHRNILIFNTSRFSYFSPESVHSRIRGFMDEMKLAEIPDISARTALCVPHTLCDVSLKLKSLLRRFPETTLIATDSDETAELLWTAARHDNLSVGDSIVLTGFGNCAHLPIASVEQYPEQIGIQAADLLQSLANGKEEISRQKEVPAKLVHLEYLSYV